MAAMSCIDGLTGIGIRPTIIKCAPAEATEIRSHVMRRAPMLLGRSTPMTAPYATRRAPDVMTVVLNMRAEKSWKVPSCEKCSVHHIESLVVRIAIRTPMTSAPVASEPRRCVAPAGEWRAGGCDEVAEGRALASAGWERRRSCSTGAIMVIRGHRRVNGNHPRRVDPPSPGRLVVESVAGGYKNSPALTALTDRPKGSAVRLDCERCSPSGGAVSWHSRLWTTLRA